MQYKEIILNRSDGGCHFRHANLEDSKLFGNRNKIGGSPDWIQNPEVFFCDSCSTEMVFYGQLDSINDEFSLGDSGMIYVFVCPTCLLSKSIIQSY